MKNKNIKIKLENIYKLQQLLKENKNDMFEAMELQHEIKDIKNNKINNTFDEWICDIESEINKIDKELTFILNCINQIRDSEDKEIITELYINHKTIKVVEKEFNMEHEFMLETLEDIYIQLKRIIKKNQVNYDL